MEDRMDFFDVITVDKAKKLLEEVFASLCLPREEVRLDDAYDRILAYDYIAQTDVPEFNRSTVDGYAVRSKDTFGATESVPSLLDLIGKVAMGEKTELSIGAGEAVYVPTGGMLPQGADAVVMIENSQKLEGGIVAINKAAHPASGVIFAGDDIKKGSVLMPQGRRIDPLDVGVLASAGLGKVLVYSRLKVFIISTGDEVVDMEGELPFGKIRDINGYALASFIRKGGGIVSGRAIIHDNYDALRNQIEKALEISDMVLISGGSSVGEKDYTYKAINSFGGRGVFIKGIAVKPGKPTIVGEAMGKPVFGLPGHPVSAIIAYKLLVEHLLMFLTGAQSQETTVRASLVSNFHSSPGKLTCQLVKLLEDDGMLKAEPIFGKSGLISQLARASGYIKIDEDTEGLYEGETVEVFLL